MYGKRCVYLMAAASVCSLLFVHRSAHADAEVPVDFALRNVMDNTTFSTADHKDRCMVIIFGSIYCKPCIEMIPVINRIHETYKDDGLTAVGIDIDVCSDDEKLRNFAVEKGIKFRFLVDNNRVAKKYKVFMLPTTLVVDMDGQIIKRYTNLQSYATIEKQVKKCLDRKGKSVEY